MPKDKSDREVVRVTKIDYYPNQKDKEAYRKELLLIIWGINDRGRRVEILIKGCEPRFWTPENPGDTFIPAEVKRYITKITREGHSFVTDEPLYCIYVKYPFGTIFHKLRDCFDVTYQADVKFNEAVRSFYGIQAYISIPRNRYNIHISEVTPIETPEEHIPTNDYILDIETSDADGFAGAEHPTAPIRNLTLLHVQSGAIYQAIATTANPGNINFLLRDWQFINSVVDKKEGVKVEPLPADTKIQVHLSDDSDAEENERGLFVWLEEAVQKLGITTICQFTDYDTSYIIERAKKCNSKIGSWNYKNDGDRKYYPRHIFKSTNVIDLEKVYQKFIFKSAPASGRTALNWMGMEELDYGKVIRPAIDEMFYNSPDMLAIYNIWDCVLPDRVMKKCGELVEKYQALCNFFGCGLDNWNMPQNCWEQLLMHRLENKKLLYSVKNVPRDSGMEAGGFVSDKAPSGIFENMIELDNSGEYNAVVLTGNMGYKTLVKDKTEVGDRPVSKFPSGRWYYLDKPGLIPSILKEMIEKIDEYKREIKKVKADLKILYDSKAPKIETEILEARLGILDQLKYIYKSGSLSATGIQGTGGSRRPFRLAHGGIGSDVTECGRDHIHWNNEFIVDHTLFWKRMYVADEFPVEFYMILLNDEKTKDPASNCGEFGCNSLKLVVIYNDTDSCKCKIEGKIPEFKTDEEMNKFLNSVGNIYSRALNRSFDEFAIQELGPHVTNHYFNIKVDAIYKRYFQWGANKNYVYKDFNDKIKYKGVKLVKRGTAFVIQAFMKKFFDIVMDDISKDEIISQLRDLLIEYESDLLAGKYTKECGEPRGVHTETLYWDSMIHSNTIFDKEFRMGDVAVFYPAKSAGGKPLPKNKNIALEYGDDPTDFGVDIDFKDVLRKLKKSIEKILNGIEPGTTWESICDNLKQGSFDDNDDLW